VCAKALPPDTPLECALSNQWQYALFIAFVLLPNQQRSNSGRNSSQAIFQPPSTPKKVYFHLFPSLGCQGSSSLLVSLAGVFSLVTQRSSRRSVAWRDQKRLRGRLHPCLLSTRWHCHPPQLYSLNRSTMALLWISAASSARSLWNHSRAEAIGTGHSTQATKYLPNPKI